MKKFDELKLKRREQKIIDLQQENEELRNHMMAEEVLKDKQREADALLYQLNELQNKLCEEIREFEKARDEYIAEKRRFAKLNIEYKRKMDKYFKQIGYKKEEAT
jgi:hypothetical protein